MLCVCVRPRRPYYTTTDDRPPCEQTCARVPCRRETEIHNARLSNAVVTCLSPDGGQISLLPTRYIRAKTANPRVQKAFFLRHTRIRMYRVSHKVLRITDRSRIMRRFKFFQQCSSGGAFLRGISLNPRFVTFNFNRLSFLNYWPYNENQNIKTFKIVMFFHDIAVVKCSFISDLNST